MSVTARPFCRYCDTPLGGGPGCWWSLVTTGETCSKSPTTFHEAVHLDPPPPPGPAGRAIIWLLTRTVRSVPNTGENWVDCRDSRFTWGVLADDRSVIRLRVLGVLNGLLPGKRRFVLHADQHTGEVLRWSFRKIGVLEPATTYGQEVR